MSREVLHWAHLYSEVVTSGLCTGCAGCVVACPHDVLGYNDVEGVYKPFHLEEELGPADCGHGQRGWPSRSTASPRTSSWPAPPIRSCTSEARTAVSCRPSCCGPSSTATSTPPW